MPAVWPKRPRSVLRRSRSKAEPYFKIVFDDGIVLTFETTDVKTVKFTPEGIGGSEAEITQLPLYGVPCLNMDGTGCYEPIGHFVGENSFAVADTGSDGQNKTVMVTVAITHLKSAFSNGTGQSGAASHITATKKYRICKIAAFSLAFYAKIV